MTETTCAPDTECGAKLPMRDGFDRSPKSLDSALNRRQVFKVAAGALAFLGISSLADQALAATASVKAGKATDVPVKGAKAYTLKGQYVLVTQPTKGVFKAFSGICSHQGAQIAGIQGTNLVCTVHGATFSTSTGAVTGGPAPTGLQKFTVTNKAGTLYINL